MEEVNKESMLTSIKKLLGIPEEHIHFDTDMIMHINSVFMILTQLGVGPSSGFKISDKTTTWDEYISDTKKHRISKVIYTTKLSCSSIHQLDLQSLNP